MKNVLSLSEVWKIYDLGEVKVNALRGVNIEVNQGDFIAIKGPSGSGKSTMMNMIGCLDVPSKGTIKLSGIDISTLEESDLAQIRGKKIGFIFQKFNLIPTLTVLENVMLPMMFQGVPKSKRIAKAKELLAMVDLSNRLNHLPNEISGGQQQRVAIARALSNDPEIILADEPTGNLDSKMGVVVMEFLERLNKEFGKTIIMVTHDDNLSKFAKKIAVLKDGQIVDFRINENQISILNNNNNNNN
ncbi:MAG: ABC transporter ATP-binding protein [Candidatus Nanoarchaeia archaeon]|nr:ABC transporter ATP-binding protein [Candidatus Nanoarchaeia archaeon]